ncbi:PorV/PorQ family protein, partial [Candidatus Desantisbacteria bacterium]|nr:PorV/PorQ family protein [Candidatus Desantisbacteria bacterium]
SKMKKISILVVGMVLISTVVFAKDKDETGAAFLKLGAGARASALGEAYVGLADDVSAAYWNPAGLAQLEERQACFMYLAPLNKVDSLSYNYLSMVVPNGIGVTGISVYYLDYGNMDEHTDADGIPDGRWDASDISAAFSLGRKLRDNLAVGGTFKGITTNIADKRANAVAVDIGVLYNTGKPGLNLGAVIRNLGTKIKYMKEGDKLPLALKGGLSYQLSDIPITLVCDVTLPNDNDAYIGFGGEYIVKKVLALRAGYKSGPQDEGSGLSAGFGLFIKKASQLTFEYAYQPYGELGDSHYVSLQRRF